MEAAHRDADGLVRERVHDPVARGAVLGHDGHRVLLRLHDVRLFGQKWASSLCVC